MILQHNSRGTGYRGASNVPPLGGASHACCCCCFYCFLCAIFAQLLYTKADADATSDDALPAPCFALAEPEKELRNLHRHCLLTLRAFLRFSVCPCLATCASVCVCVSLPVSSLAASCLFLMCIFTDADFYFFAGCDISFSSSSAYRAALNVAL